VEQLPIAQMGESSVRRRSDHLPENRGRSTWHDSSPRFTVPSPVSCAPTPMWPQLRGEIVPRRGRNTYGPQALSAAGRSTTGRWRKRRRTASARAFTARR
jgi:hypothetical protein